MSSPDCEIGGGLNYAFRYTYEDEEAILAVGTPDGNIWCNPNNCAGKWQESLTCFGGISGTLKDNCTDLSELDYPGEVFTNKCGTVCSGNDGEYENGEGPPSDYRGEEHEENSDHRGEGHGGQRKANYLESEDA